MELENATRRNDFDVGGTFVNGIDSLQLRLLIQHSSRSESWRGELYFSQKKSSTSKFLSIPEYLQKEGLEWKEMKFQ
jgi:hypothetical protein